MKSFISVNTGSREHTHISVSLSYVDTCGVSGSCFLRPTYKEYPHYLQFPVLCHLFSSFITYLLTEELAMRLAVFQALGRID